MAPRITVPLFITCQRDGCGQVTRVRNRYFQQVQRFCSRRCGATARRLTKFSREAMSRGGKMRASRARARLIQAVANMTPVEAFRVGYLRGLQIKWRKTKQLLTKRSAA